ncbi:MAG: molybdopterin molybdenumtransferase MoeA, partial [Rhodospirillales bacterium]|nr:molybdopterin molybdenumtransferase MoeA [Rhodospirillales bacterium]
MTQLKDDCFAHGGDLMPLDQALSDLRGRMTCVVGTETVSLTESLGRILSRDVTAPRDVPPHDNSAVDGYAVYFDDLRAEGEAVL